MATTLGYGRVSTRLQASFNQGLDLENIGCAIEDPFADTVSGEIHAV